MSEIARSRRRDGLRFIGVSFGKFFTTEVLNRLGMKHLAEEQRLGLTIPLIFAAAQESPMAQDSATCAVCHRPLQLEICVTDENGCVVHESCFQKTVWNVCAPSTYDQLEELLQEARE